MDSLPALPTDARRQRRRRGIASFLAWGLLVCSILLSGSGSLCRQEEYKWRDVTAEVQGHELVFSDDEGAQHVLLGFSPPAGAPVWQNGDKVKLSYYRGKPQFAVLREKRPENLSDTVELWGIGLLVTAVPLAFLVARRVERRRAAEASSKPASAAGRRSVLDWCAYAGVGLLLGLAMVCAFCVLSLLVSLLLSIHYDPDANSEVVASLGGIVIFFVAAVLLALLSLALYRRDLRIRGL